ncbi:hypothetical protein M8J76_005442 [Diaphorina citri]|nr:hypothetical protein M8J75_000772 [Diaphorina citri]KAI5722214.1 hypothetical protein M8J76_005442 [Diaphorina citri]KAI5724498.1 hypothetical protein M8J77_003425 [Diaphorina citri]
MENNKADNKATSYDKTEEYKFDKTMEKNKSDELQVDRSCVRATALDKYYNENFNARFYSVVVLRLSEDMKEEHLFPLKGQNSHRVKFRIVDCNGKPFGVWFFGCGLFRNFGDLNVWAYRGGPDTTLLLSSDKRQIDVYHADCFNEKWRHK